MKSMLVTLAVLVVASPPFAAGETPATPPPAIVTAVGAPLGVLVAWQPVEPASGEDVVYEVFGIREDGTETLLKTTRDTHALVQGEFDRYGVLAIVEGKRGAMAHSCVALDPYPPGEPVALHPEDCSVLPKVDGQGV